MQKDFDNWNKTKKCVQTRADPPFFQEGEVWWCSLGVNVGSEEDGKYNGFERPVYILKKFNNDIFWGLPVTSQEESGRYYFTYTRNAEPFSVILSQIRLLDNKRLKRNIFLLSREDRKRIKQKFQTLVGWI